MNEGIVPKKWGETGTNYRGPAILNGALGPNMLHIFHFSRSALSGVSQKCAFTGVRNRSLWP